MAEAGRFPLIDPVDPRAPSAEVWERLSPAERARVLAELPASVPYELYPPEGDAHRAAREGIRGVLDSFYRRLGRRVYVASELVVYYPGQARFVPDVLAVTDVEPHERNSWVVSAEGKGLDVEEVADKLGRLVDELVSKREAAERERDREREARELLERELSTARAELERLRRGAPDGGG